MSKNNTPVESIVPGQNIDSTAVQGDQSTALVIPNALPLTQEVSLKDYATLRNYLVKTKDVVEIAIQRGGENTELLKDASAYIDKALNLNITPTKTGLFRRWTVLMYIVMAGLAEVFFIQLYCWWHGAEFISLNLYSPANIAKLSALTFVNGPTTMSVAAEVLMWSSLGVWAQASYNIARDFVSKKTNYPLDIASYIGTMARNTSIAAIVVIILRLSKFSVFGVSLDAASPLAFDATIGISFLLGFFGDDAYRIICHFRDKVVRGVKKD
jgi:hypothetical protein